MTKDSQSAIDQKLEALIVGYRKHPQLKKVLRAEVRNLEKLLRSLRTARARKLALAGKKQEATQLCQTLTEQAMDAAACVRDGALWVFGRRDERLADLGIKTRTDRRLRRRTS